MMIRILLVLAATPAYAQPVASPYLHGNAGDVEIRRGGPGASLGYHGRRLGFELDLDRHHHFYKDDKLTSVPNACIPGVMGPCIDSDTDAWIVTGNVLGFLPVSPKIPWRPFGLAGAGLVHAWIHGAGEFDSDQTHLAMNLGIGTTYWISDWFGIRADLRYFHVFVDEDTPDGGYASDYDFVRLALGVSFAVP
jgi:opacity protein-like surface antigen